jgi:antitoxin FitA
VVERLRQLAKLHRRSLQGELLAIIETAVGSERQIAPVEALAEVRRLGVQTQREASQLERRVSELEEVWRR